MVRSVAARRVAGWLGWLTLALAGSLLLGFLIGLARPRPTLASTEHTTSTKRATPTQHTTPTQRAGEDA